jgi:hypothetical protein
MARDRGEPGLGTAIGERLPQLAKVISNDRVQVQVQVMAAGDVPHPAARILAPDPEAWKRCPQASHFVGFGVIDGYGLHYCRSLRVPVRTPAVNNEKR